MRIARNASRGFTLIEIMVGVVIGLIAILVIYQVFAQAELFKRNTTGLGDAQQNGLFSAFFLGVELGNAGNGLAASARSLATCPNTGDFTTTLRPIPVVITDSGATGEPDSFAVYYSVTRSIVAPAPFAQTAMPNSDYVLQSPNGFAKDDVIVAIAADNYCAISLVNSVSAPDGNGWVTVKHTGSAHKYDQSDLLAGSTGVFNLGSLKYMQKVRYDVKDGVLRATRLFDPATGQPDNAQTPNPLASNIVNMKVQYGVDTGTDNFIDTWVEATSPWDPTSVLAADLPTMSRIKAIRIGIIVRSEQYDRDAPAFDWTLFDCNAAKKSDCPGRLTGVLPAKFRYRIYETVIPLRNSIWNAQY